MDEKTNYTITLTLIIVLTALMILDIYYHAYSYLMQISITNTVMDTISIKLNNTIGIFKKDLALKTASIAVISVMMIGYKPKKELKISKAFMIVEGVAGLLLYILPNLLTLKGPLYIIFTIAGVILLIMFGISIQKIISTSFMSDRFDKENKAFIQTEKCYNTEYSVNIPYEYYYKKKKRQGWINIVNPFRAVLVSGVPGSGKTFAILEEAIRQLLEKGFCACVYDYKYPDLTATTYSYLCEYYKNYDIKPQFYVLNLDDPEHSHRCNPLQPELMTEFTDAIESAKSIMMGLNKTWIKKEGDFFVESPINFVACGIWMLRQIDTNIGENRYCTFPHLIELMSMDYQDMFGALVTLDDTSISNIMQPFVSAWEQKAIDQLEGQIASVRLGLSRLTAPNIYWATTGNDFTLDVNNPEEPKILCIGNNPDRQSIYGTVLSLYSSRMLRLINQKKKRRCALFFDELPTIYLGVGTLDNLIATGRSNKIATFMGIQDFSQMVRDYGKEVADGIINIVGSVLTGMVGEHTAESFSKKIGKIKVMRTSVNISRNDTSTNLSEQMEPFMGVEELCQLGQGELAGVLADDFSAPMECKVFCGNIKVDMKQKALAKKHKLSQLTYFPEGVDIKELMELNMYQIRNDIKELCKLLNFRYTNEEINNKDFLKDKIDLYIIYTRKRKKDKILRYNNGDEEYDKLIESISTEYAEKSNEYDLEEDEQRREYTDQLRDDIEKKIELLASQETYKFE